VVFFIALGKLIDVAFSVNSEILVFSKFYRSNLFLTIAMSILIIGANYWLIPIFGIEGAAIGSAAVMLLFNLIKYLYLKVKIQVDPFSEQTWKIVLIGLTATSVMFLTFPDLNPFFSLIIKSMGIVFLYGLGSYLMGVGKEEWDWIKSKVKKSGP
jgi:O-antigen/teichoic acid export membrane protein